MNPQQHPTMHLVASILALMLAVIQSALAQEPASAIPDAQTQQGSVEQAATVLPEGSGDTVVPLPLESALKIAMENNLNIQIEQVRIPISQAAIREREGRFDPGLYGEVINQRTEEQTSWVLSGANIYKQNSQSGKLGARKLFSVGLEADSYVETIRSRNNSELEGLEPQYRDIFIIALRQPLLEDFGTTVNTADIRVAENNVTQAQYGLEFQVINTLNQVEQIYHDLSGALATLLLAQEYLRLAEQTLADNRQRFQAGIIHVGEVQEAETAVASRRERLISAQQRARDLTNLLKNILQLKPGSPLFTAQFQTEGLRPVPDVALPSPAEAYTIALNHRPDYARTSIDLENDTIMLGYYKNQLLPRLDVVGTVGLNGLSGEAQPVLFDTGTGPQTMYNPFDGSYADSWEHLRDADGYQWSIGVTIDIPWGNRTDESRYTQARLLKDQTIMELQSLEDQIRLDIKLALENIASSKDRIAVASNLVELARKSLNQEEERMKQGLSDTFRVLIFQSNLIDSQIREVQALVDYRQALAELYRATGTTIQQHDFYLDIPGKTKKSS